uniref:Solute carrier family 13 member 1 n=1 Tax=Cyprinus carpio carpio TaxID=630221 RepID=A0A8C0YJA1_CYPCA
MTEVLPLSVTVHLPALLFPLFGIMNLHRRIALRLVTGLGVNPGMLMLGFMVGCAFLSKWLSNTSTVAMVMPIVEAVIQQVLNASEETSKDHKGALNGISKPARLQFGFNLKYGTILDLIELVCTDSHYF